MARQVYAITTCRVSSSEQLENNSLNRQREAVLRAAKELGVIVPDDGQWSGSVSSKAGTNIERKDLQEMLDYCKKHRQVKYLIVHEVDRFMRSMKELFHFEMMFERLGVKVWYASQPELNSDDAYAKLMKAFEAFKGEGSNIERQKKSIDGQTSALREGRYPFPPKPGYKRGKEKAIHEIDPLRAPALKVVLEKIAMHLLTPTQALKELNGSDFIQGGALYKMDKFRKIATDPFYAGIVAVDKQVKIRNENGLHEALISKETHIQIVRVFNGKPKNQAGPRKNGNPKYPCNNIVACDNCTDKRYGRVVGFDGNNGKPNSKVYEKYRCRSCGTYVTRDELHAMVVAQFEANRISQDGLDMLIKALKTVWKRKESDIRQESIRINHKIGSLRSVISQQVEGITDPANISVKEDILVSIAAKKSEVAKLEESLELIEEQAHDDEERFLRFAFRFLEDIGSRFLSPDLSHENRLRCKQIIFPAGFRLSKNKKVYTQEISPLYRLATNKKDLPETEKSFMVRVRRL